MHENPLGRSVQSSYSPQSWCPFKHSFSNGHRAYAHVYLEDEFDIITGGSFILVRDTPHFSEYGSKRESGF